MKSIIIRIFYLLLVMFNNSLSFASNTNGYTTSQAFWDLYYDFTGNNDPDYPKGKINISQTLYQSETQQNKSLTSQTGPLIMFINSTLYVYNSDRKLELKQLLRTAPNTGFTEMTAISHIGTALMYLAKIKANGDSSWKSQMRILLNDVKAVRAVNSQTNNNWLDQINAPSWKPYLTTIHNMVDYACSMAGNYMSDVLSGKESFNTTLLQNDFLNGNKIYSIPYNNVMVGTFMLTALQSMDELHREISKLKLDWPKTKVLIRFVAGSNVSAGVTKGSNWLVPFIEALANNTLSADRIYMVPYAEVKSSLGANELSQADFDYYDTIWNSRHDRSVIANAVFINIPSIFLPDRPTIPGDYAYSKKPKIEEFLIRLKFSLAEPTEMLSNTVGFWMAGELAAKNWNYNNISIPGITTGFPQGIATYPDDNPIIH